MLNLIPKPNEFSFNSDASYLLSTDIKFNLVNYEEYLNSFAKTAEDKTLDEDAYIIDIKDDINVLSSSKLGLFYAAISLYQLSINYSNKLPCVKIIDKPRFKFRGFMFDVGRYFFSVSEVKSIIDLCAYHKINKFHFHLTEDQGWRIEIKKYPLLTQKGSKRSHTNYHLRPHSGFYTQDELKDLVLYCKERFIELIPEIDIPGHSSAAMACYNHLGCFDRKLKVATSWGVKHDILCAGKESTYEFEKDVLKEVMDICDSSYMHIGGDEAPKTRWKICPNCQAKMKELNLKNENELQSYFVNNITDFITSNKKQAIMWNEYDLTDNLNKDIIWQVWDVGNKMEEISNACIKDNRKVIFSIASDAYLDLPCALTPVENCYNLPHMKDFEKGNLMGVEAALWSEFVPDMKTALRRTLPRLSALAEAMWTNSENKNYEEYLQKLPSYVEFVKTLGYKTPNKRIYFPSSVRKIMQKIWFERRQLTWNGLYNAIDNARVLKKYKK